MEHNSFDKCDRDSHFRGRDMGCPSSKQGGRLVQPPLRLGGGARGNIPCEAKHSKALFKSKCTPTKVSPWEN